MIVYIFLFTLCGTLNGIDCPIALVEANAFGLYEGAGGCWLCCWLCECLCP